MSCILLVAGCGADPMDAHDATTIPVASTPLVRLQTTTGPRDEQLSLIASSQGVHRAAVAAFDEDGRDRVVVAFHDPSANDTGSGMAFARSEDGGAHWSSGVVPVARVQPQGLGPMIAEPTIAASPIRNDRGGVEVYFAAVSSVPSLSSALHRQIVVSRSIDGGRTFLPAVVAAAPRINDFFQTADHPSLSVDAGGRVHLVFLADAGLPTEGMRHWVGYPDSTACGYSCMWWLPMNEVIDPGPEHQHIVGVTLRSMRNALYIAYEQLESDPDDLRLGYARLVVLRFDPFLRTWVHTDDQPARGRWFRVPALADGPGGLVSAGRHFDFGFQGETGWLTWSQIGNDDSTMLLAQSFHFLDVLTERWDDSDVVLETPPGTRIMQPTLAIRGDERPTLSWLEQTVVADSSTTTLFGSVRAGIGDDAWTAPRDLATVGDAVTPTPSACGGKTPWLDQIAAIGLGGMTPMTLTIHANASCGSAPVADDSLAATRWTEARPSTR